MVDVSGGNIFMKIHLSSQHDQDFNNCDVSCGNGFINIHTIYQCNDPNKFHDMGGGVLIGDMGDGRCSMNNHTLYQKNGLKPLIN